VAGAGLTRVRRFIALLGLFLFAAAAPAEALIYELYELAPDGSRALLAKGTRQYALADVSTIKLIPGLSNWGMKEVEVVDGFFAGASIYQEKELTGFGLWLKDRGTWRGRLSHGGFSWEWFVKESGPVFVKLQEGGRVRVRFVAAKPYEEIASVEVLEDLTLRLKNTPWFFFRDGDTHHLLLKRGSVLRFAR
jgi:hypothetical protein